MQNSSDRLQQLTIPNGQAIDTAKLLDEFCASRIWSNAQPNEVGSCAWSSDGQYFAWSCGYRIVKVVPWIRYKQWKDDVNKKGSEASLERPEEVIIDTGEYVQSIAFGARSKAVRRNSIRSNLFRYLVFDDVVLVTGLCNGRIRTWDIKTGSLQVELIDHTRSITDLSFSPTGTWRLLSASLEGCLKVWDMEDDGNLIKTLWTKSKSVFGCAWSPTGRVMASVGDYKSVLLWDMETYTILRSLVGHQHDVRKCCFSADGALLATSSYDTRVIVWKVDEGVPLLYLFHLLPPPSMIFAGGANGCYVRCVSFSPDGTHVGTVCDDGFVRYWDLMEPQVPVLASPTAGALSCQFSPDGSVLAVGTIQGKALLWQTDVVIPSLQHLCRLSIRRYFSSVPVESLGLLPQRIRQFLKYEFFWNAHLNSNL